MAVQMGKLLCRLRKKRGFTQAELGKGIVSKSVVSRIENGLENPSVLVLNELFRRLGASLEPFELVVTGKEYEAIKNMKQSGLMTTTVISENDILREIRLAKGLSQEQLSRDICARETVSNIEHGRTPNRKNIQGLLERLGEQTGNYFGYVDSLEYEVYELVQRYQKLVQEDRCEAERLRLEIAERLDKNIPVNRQFLESSKLLEQSMNGLLEPGEVMAGLENCLRYTMEEYDGSIYRIPHRQEVVILEKIVDCLRSLKQVETVERLAGVLRSNEKLNSSSC